MKKAKYKVKQCKTLCQIMICSSTSFSLLTSFSRLLTFGPHWIEALACISWFCFKLVRDIVYQFCITPLWSKIVTKDVCKMSLVTNDCLGNENCQGSVWRPIAVFYRETNNVTPINKLTLARQENRLKDENCDRIENKKRKKGERLKSVIHFVLFLI